MLNRCWKFYDLEIKKVYMKDSVLKDGFSVVRRAQLDTLELLYIKL